MPAHRYLLPATATDTEAQMQLTAELVRERHRKGLSDRASKVGSRVEECPMTNLPAILSADKSG